MTNQKSKYAFGGGGDLLKLQKTEFGAVMHINQKASNFIFENKTQKLIG